MNNKTITWGVHSGHSVGQIIKIGMFGGAISDHYRIDAINDGTTTLTFKNPNGTCSHRFEVA